MASTSEVYGNSPDVPFKEDSSLSIGPSNVARWGYACSKLYDEFLALAYHQEKGLPVVILRLFNTVGPRQSGRYGMVVPRFVSQAQAGSPITIYGDGLQTRCFTHVRDVVQAMARIILVPEAEGQVFNLGNNHEITIQQLSELVIKTLGSNSRMEYVPYSEAYGVGFEDIRHRVPDISKIQSCIDYQPSNDLAETINEMADSLRSIDGGSP
jgi:UDP-glucose 4-epimerase